MGADEAWDHDMSGEVILLFCDMFGYQIRGLADFSDARVLDENCAVCYYLPFLIDRDDSCVCI